MLTHALLLLTLATPDEPVRELPRPTAAATHTTTATRTDPAQARETAAALQEEMDADLAADAVLATRAGQRLVLSALLCEAAQRKSDVGDQLELQLTTDLLVADKRADADIDRARERLAVLAIQPLACDTWAVGRVVNCLSLLPSVACTEDEALAAQVRAAERLERTLQAGGTGFGEG